MEFRVVLYKKTVLVKFICFLFTNTVYYKYSYLFNIYIILNDIS